MIKMVFKGTNPFFANMPPRNSRKPYHVVNSLSNVNKNRVDWQLPLRACRTWVIPPFQGGPETLEVLFADVEGNRVQATIKPYLVEKFGHHISVGSLYLVGRFSVVDKPRNFPASDVAFKINFVNDTTVIEDMTDDNFPLAIFKFKSFADILGATHRDSNPLFDVIGDIVEAKTRTENKKRHLEFLLRDINNNRIKCVLWEPYYTELHDFAVDCQQRVKPDRCMIIQLCRTKLFQGEMGISSTYNATKVIVDQDHQEIVDFKSRLPAMTGQGDGSVLSDSSSMSIREELLNPSTISMSLKSLLSCVVPCKVWVVATISDIEWNKGWFYTSCVGCKKKVLDEDGKFYCEKCNAHVIGDPRYRIQVKVAGGAANATFLLWNSAAEPVVGHSAAEILQSFDSKSTDTNGDVVKRDVGTIDCPNIIDENICGRELLFKVSVVERSSDFVNIIYAVDKTCADEDLIEMHDKCDDDISTATDTNVIVDSVGDPNLTAELSLEGDIGAHFVSPDAMSVKRVRVVDTDDLILGDGEKSITSKRMNIGPSVGSVEDA